MAQSLEIEPKVTIIILNYNGFEDTKKCIHSLECYKEKLNIIVVDNASNDNSKELLLKEFPELKILSSDKNLGYAGGMNIGIRYALENKAEYIIIANNDIIFSKNFLEPLLQTASSNNVGIVSPKVLYTTKPNIIYCAGGEMNYLLCGGVAKYQGKETDKFGNESREITIAEGSCFLAKREVFETIGLMNEKFFMYFEEVEFSERVRKRYKIMYNPDAIIYHRSGAGHNWAEYSPLYYYYYSRNRLWLFSDCNKLYFIYVFLFSLLNVCAKSLKLVLAYLTTVNKSKNKVIIKIYVERIWCRYQIVIPT